MANAFDENTMNCSLETASTAGTESTAKITSVASISSSTANSGVASRMPLRTVNSFWPSYSSVDGTNRWTTLRNRELPGSTWSLSVKVSLPAV